MKDSLGFSKVGSEESSAPVEAVETVETQSDAESQETEATEVETIEAQEETSTDEETSSRESETETESSTETDETETETQAEDGDEDELEPEVRYVDPFEGLEGKEREIFEVIKKGDLPALRDYLIEATTDYDKLDDYDVIVKQLIADKPKWTQQMIEAELEEKYGYGLDEDELTDREIVKYQKNLLEAGETAREKLKAKQSELKFPEFDYLTPKQQEQVEAVAEEEFSAEEVEKYKSIWESQVDSEVNSLTDEILKIEIGEDGSKEAFDFPIVISTEDKQAYSSQIKDFDLNVDFTNRYVKDGKVDVAKFAKDKFMADNAEKLIKAAFTQGFTKGNISKIKADKNIDLTQNIPNNAPVDSTAQRSESARSFFNNKR